ncbi:MULTISPECIES: hypothetical protein [unclassified Methylobacterium]|uniref:hypothetical protein n=1 Tax=unclassified Methylobacterium TaxID=2615210 RepID=UPI001F35C3DF|nr:MULTISPECIES: hypothetical protein [Methylobacterium]WFT78262.1 hypothetical protein QA634_23695 [Methylobacterium nodulans]
MAHYRSAAGVGLPVMAAAMASSALACATPFAAFATWAALRLPRRAGLLLITAVWLTNQAVGFGLHGYPLDPSTIGWGLAIGSGMLLAWAAAAATSRLVRAEWPAILPSLVIAFLACELALCTAGFVLPGDAEAFAPSVVAHLFLINLAALGGFVLLQAAGEEVAHRWAARRLQSA